MSVHCPDHDNLFTIDAAQLEAEMQQHMQQYDAMASQRNTMNSMISSVQPSASA